MISNNKSYLIVFSSFAADRDIDMITPGFQAAGIEVIAMDVAGNVAVAKTTLPAAKIVEAAGVVAEENTLYVVEIGADAAGSGSSNILSALSLATKLRRSI